MTRIEVVGGAGPRETAAIIAAVARLVEEQEIVAATPPARPTPSLWVLSGRPRPVPRPFTRSVPSAPGWSLADSNGED